MIVFILQNLFEAEADLNFITNWCRHLWFPQNIHFRRFVFLTRAETGTFEYKLGSAKPSDFKVLREHKGGSRALREHQGALEEY